MPYHPEHDADPSGSTQLKTILDGAAGDGRFAGAATTREWRGRAQDGGGDRLLSGDGGGGEGGREGGRESHSRPGEGGGRGAGNCRGRQRVEVSIPRKQGAAAAGRAKALKRFYDAVLRAVVQVRLKAGGGPGRGRNQYGSSASSSSSSSLLF